MSKRRLAAIMFSDIVGYDSLLKEDEKKTFEAHKKNQRIHRRLIKKFDGRWLKEMESGTLASFSSIIDAVTCALALQKATKEIESPVRIGIHQGEVIFEKKDVLGDGVNIASRIQNVINNNAIVISDTVYKDIKNKAGLEIESLGTQALKGIESPFEIYTVSCSDESVLDFSIDTGELVRPMSFGRSTIIVGVMVIAFLAYALYYFLPKGSTTPSEPEKSLLILPFESYIDTDTLDFLVAGMHDALIGNIGKINALRVKSTTTARAYQNVGKSIPEIASELGVNVVVEGSILCLGDSICLRIVIVDPEDETQIWIKEYYEERTQIFNLYNRITREITDEINVNLRPYEETLLSEYRAVDPEAYNAYVKGKLLLDKIDRRSLPLAAEQFARSIEIDPNWAPPYAGLAEVGQYQKQMAFENQAIVLPDIYKNLYRALELDPNSANTHYTKAVISVWSEYDWVKGEEEFQKALELNPSDALCRVFYAHLLTILGRIDEAKYQGEQAFKLDPQRPFVLGLYTRVLIWAHDYKSAIAISKEAISHDPNHYFATRAMSRAFYYQGEYDKWFEYWKRHFWWEKDELITIEEIFNNKGYKAAIGEIINVHEKAYRNGNQIHLNGQAHRYMQIQSFDRAIDYFKLMYETRDPNAPYISTYPIHYPDIKNNPEYIELLNKMNLPLQ